jgi:L-ascorbate metabolism protein UlaG (beta-lactamase superfamily)
MQITWYGMSCFEIVALRAKGEHVTILIDPLDEAVTGIKMPKVAADIVLCSNNDYVSKDLKKINGAFLVDHPGEYEIKGVYIQGVASLPEAKKPAEEPEKGGKAMPSRKASAGEGKNKETEAAVIPGTIFAIEVEDMQLCHLGNLQQSELAEDQITKIGNVDILMCPVGIGDGLGAKEALKVMSQIEPSVAIPMNYKIPQAKMELAALEEFTKEAGLGKIEPLPKLVIKKKDINPEESKIVVLTQ